MSKLYKIIIPILAIGAFTLFSAEFLNGSGSPGGFSGSPGDGNATCTTCHGGTASPQTAWITSNIPASGYIAGQTYTVTATLTHSGAVRYGFELTAENASAQKIGTFVISNSSETKLTNAGKAVTHTFSGTTGSAGSKSWSFDWQAPIAGTGNVTFFGAFNAANGNGTTSGDVIYTSNLSVQENVSTSVSAFNAPGVLGIYPNPAKDRVYIAKEGSLAGLTYQLSDLQGKIWVNGTFDESKEIAVNELPKGMYLLTLGGNNTQKLLIQ